MEDTLSERCPWKGVWVWATAGRVSSQVLLPCSWEVRCPLQSWARSRTQVQPSPPRLQPGRKTGSQMPNHSPRIQSTLGDHSGAPWGSPPIWDMLFGGQGVLFILLFSHSTTQGMNYFAHEEKKKKICMFTHVSALWYEYQHPLHGTT